MEKFEDEGSSFVECSVSWLIEVDVGVCSVSSDALWTEAVCSEALCLGTLCSEVVFSGTLNSGTRISEVGTKVFVGEFGCWCWGLSVITSSKAMAEAVCWFDTY